MRTCSSSNLPVESSPNPTSSNTKHRNRRRSKQPFILEESPIDTMANQRTMAELLRTPTEGYAEAIVEDLVSKFINEFFPPLRTKNLRNEISNFQQRFDESFHEAWDRYKDLLRACPHHGFTELQQLDTFYNALNPVDQDSLNSAAGGNLLKRRTQDVLTIIENKSKIAKLTHAVNQQTSAVTTAMTSILKQFQATQPPASVKAVEEIYVTCGGAHLYYQCLAAGGNTFPELRDNIQGYVAAATVNYNQGSGHLPSNTIANPKGELKAITTQSGIVLDGPFIHIPTLFINLEEDERVEETLTDQDLADYPQEVGDPRKFLIPCDFSELKCKALADLGASINLMPLSVWKKLGLPELISTRMTIELANRAICTLAGFTRDVFIPVGKFTFPADFVIVDYESDSRVPLILGRPFLRTTRALIDVHGEEMILRDGDERLTLNMRHDTLSYSNQPKKESINMINIYDDSSEDFLGNLFATNQPSGNPTFYSHPKLTSLEVKDDVFNLEGGNVLSEKLLDLDSTKDLHPPHNVNPLSGSTTSSSSPNHLLEEFANELALITFPPRNDDLPFDIESDLKEIEYLLNHDPIKDMDSILKDSIDQITLLILMIILLRFKSDTEYVYDDLFDSKGEKVKESKLLIDELDLPSDFLPSFEYDSFLSEDFSEVDALPSTNNEDKVFNSGILIQKNLFEIITHVASDKNVKKLAISHASLILKDFDPPLYELPFFREVPGAENLFSFSFENEEKVSKPRILTSKGIHSSLIPELSHQGYKVFKIIKILKSPMEIFLFSHGEDIRILDVPCPHFYLP
nr:reverse transcriptase domain-containing protein [Tanacetum cinerariifolium]GEY05511.1 reverse transcriptase domain-containing protein [Tanacetum cinerariifolium]